MEDAYRILFEITSDWCTVEILESSPKIKLRLARAFNYQDLSHRALKRLRVTPKDVALGRVPATKGMTELVLELDCPDAFVTLRTRKGSIGYLRVTSGYGDSQVNEQKGGDLNEKTLKLKLRDVTLLEPPSSPTLRVDDPQLYRDVYALEGRAQDEESPMVDGPDAT